MVLTANHIAPIVALVAGVLILIVPRLLSFIVAIYLIVVGLIGLNLPFRQLELRVVHEDGL